VTPAQLAREVEIAGGIGIVLDGVVKPEVICYTIMGRSPPLLPRAGDG